MPKIVKRYPRLQGVTSKAKLFQKILHRTYNNLSQKRKFGKRMIQYDIYKTKQGRNASIQFLMLAIDLTRIRPKVDPKEYLTVMSQYGVYANSKFMPHPSWLASEEAIKIYAWKLISERNKWERDDDWKKSKEGWSERDIFKTIKNSSEFLLKAAELRGISEMDAMSLLLGDLNPWFLATYLPNVTKRVQTVLTTILKTMPELWQDIMTCIMYYRKKPQIWQQSKKILAESLGKDELPEKKRYPRL